MGARLNIPDILTIDVASVAPALRRFVRQAHRQFGKASSHRVTLNDADCFAYALAIDRNAPRLFKGNDFSQTDVGRA
jgi:ribonuclease VapC